MLVVVLAYGSESRAAEAALDAAESGKLARWDPRGAAVVKSDRTARLEVTAATPIGAEPDPSSWWTPLVAALAQGPLGDPWGIAAGELWAAFVEYGVDDRFLRAVVQAMAPGSSGWFLDIGAKPVNEIREYAEQTNATFLVADIPPEIEEHVVEAMARVDESKVTDLT